MSSLQLKRRIKTVNIKLFNELFEKLSEILPNNNEEIQCQSLIDICGTITEKFRKVIQLDEEISLLIEDDDELQQDAESCTEFTLLCKNEFSIISKHLKKHDPMIDSLSLTNNSKNKTIKLPIIKLEPFNGKRL